MSAIANIMANKALTHLCVLNTGASGVLNTDVVLVTMNPIGIDKNGVAKFRNSAAVDIQSAEVCTFSSEVSGERVVSKVVVQVPYDVILNGVTTKKFVSVELKMGSTAAHTNVHRRAALQMLLEITNFHFKADMISGSSPY